MEWHSDWREVLLRASCLGKNQTYIHFKTCFEPCWDIQKLEICRYAYVNGPLFIVVLCYSYEQLVNDPGKYVQSDLHITELQVEHSTLHLKRNLCPI